MLALTGKGSEWFDMQRLQDGDIRTFRTLYKIFQPALLQQCDPPGLYRLPERIVQHAFIKCWLRSERFTNPDEVIGFLYTAVREQCTSEESPNDVDLLQDKLLDEMLSHDILEDLSIRQRYRELSMHPHWKRELARGILADKYYGRQLRHDEPSIQEAWEHWNAVRQKPALQRLHLIFGEACA